ncbi:MAG: adenosylcobinamide-GDP ribazoletransferase [Deltaproteobacteria bacterium]|nr:adenosylcobinamide-GDP ribazoletransferase [Deltaproteobacteria bacterium]
MNKSSGRPPRFFFSALLDDLAGALQFLTILPLGPSDRFDPRRVMRFFPVAGIVIGSLVSAFDALATLVLPLPVAAALDVALLALVTGALHLDGLADTADGLLGPHDRTRALAIMKDSRVGAMGVVTVALVLIVKTVALGAVSDHRTLALILVPAFARSAMMVAMAVMPYARKGGGTGRAFFHPPARAVDLAAIALPLGLSVFLGWRCIVIITVFAAVTILMLQFYRRRMGGVTGDLIGALGEVVEAALWVALVAGVAS